MCQIHTLLHEYPKKHNLSIEWIADTIGVPVDTLYRYLNPNDPLPFPLKLMIPFMKTCNDDFSALDLLESRIGRTAYVSSSEKGALGNKEAAKIAEGAGRAVGVIVTALADGFIDEAENETCTKHLLKLQKSVSDALVRLNENKQLHRTGFIPTATGNEPEAGIKGGSGW